MGTPRWVAKSNGCERTLWSASSTEEIITPRQWSSLIVFGRYEELPLTPDHQHARQVAERLFQKYPMWWEPATVPLGGHDRRPPIVFRIHVDSVTGRRTIHEAAPEDRQGAPESKQPRWLTRMWRRLVAVLSRSDCHVRRHRISSSLQNPM